MTDQSKTTPYHDAMVSALVQQGIVLVLSGMILDGGGIAQNCFAAFLAFWVGAVLTFIRRRHAPTKLDLMLIRWGYLPLCFVTAVIFYCVWKMRGVL